MSLAENGNGMVMPVGPMYGNGGAGGGWNDSFFWIIVLIALLGGGWNNNFGGGGGAMAYAGTGAELQRGFDQQSVMGGISGLQGSINTLAQSQCNGFAGAEIAANNRQMASMQQAWNAQSAIDQRLDTLAMNQQACCCENRQAIADVKYAIANEGAATRSNTDAKVQTVMDKLCQLEMDGIKQNYENRIAGMQQNYEAQIRALNDRLNTLDRAASQNSQTAAILADNAAQTNAIEQYLAPTPRPAYVVPNPNCCPQNYNSCGCGVL